MACHTADVVQNQVLGPFAFGCCTAGSRLSMCRHPGVFCNITCVMPTHMMVRCFEFGWQVLVSACMLIITIASKIQPAPHYTIRFEPESSLLGGGSLTLFAPSFR